MLKLFNNFVGIIMFLNFRWKVFFFLLDVNRKSISLMVIYTDIKGFKFRDEEIIEGKRVENLREYVFLLV